MSFDLAIADESHRCAGPVSGDFAAILDNGAIRAERRLFQTATPRYFTDRVRRIAGEAEYEIASMDDEELFGPEFHRLSFGDAIQRDLLSDYQVVVFGVDDPTYREYVERGALVTRDGREVTDAPYLASQIALAKAMRDYDLRRTISFHSRVSRAREFGNDFPEVVAWMSEAERPSGRVWADHVHGEMPSGQRDKRLKRLREVTHSERGLLTNARCLGEGVDVPTLDGVAFMDPRSSQVDIIQAVGRAIRKAEGKKLGTIVIPVFLENADDADETIASSAFRPVWEVLLALRAHDGTLADEIDEMRRNLGRLAPRGSRKIILKGFGLESVDLPSRVGPEFAEAFWLAAALRVGEKPALSVPQVLQWADSHRTRTGEWPTAKSGPIEEWPADSWRNVSNALRLGLRGLPGGSSLAMLLLEERGLRNRSYLPDLTIGQILDWADAHRSRTGQWPEAASGRIREAAGETWTGIQLSLLRGRRGLPGGSSLPRLLAEHRGIRNSRGMPLSVDGILAWADAHHERTGEWPRKDSGPVAGTLGETWGRVNKGLMDGTRGLPGGASLAKLLAEHRGVRNVQDLPDLDIATILAWADAHHERTGKWPKGNSGPIMEAPGENWTGVTVALYQGGRGLPGGSSLAQLLDEHRDVRNIKDLPPLTIETILSWADDYHARNGRWPTNKSGAIPDMTSETWLTVDKALRRGRRGLPAASSLAQFLDEHRGVRNMKGLPPLTIQTILVWADRYRASTGRWPSKKSGPIPDSPNETWAAVAAALQQGIRGLPDRSSLSQLLQTHRGVRNSKDRSPLTVEMILAWADDYHRCNERWPTKAESGPVPGTTSETWVTVNEALRKGRRGLAVGSSLAQLLDEHRDVRNIKDLPPLTIETILSWADDYHARTGRWPTNRSGAIPDTTSETWSTVDVALRRGRRDLAGGSSLAKVLSKDRRKKKD